MNCNLLSSSSLERPRLWRDQAGPLRRRLGRDETVRALKGRRITEDAQIVSDGELDEVEVSMQPPEDRPSGRSRLALFYK